MIRVAVTGTVGAGKSAVGRLFERWGAFRVDADELARRAVAPGSPALEEIRAEWGDEVLTAEGGLDREAMRRLAFGDPAARERLEEIVHPEVARLREELLREAEAAGAEVVVTEIPLLFEKGLEEAFDVVVVVDAPREVRRRRLLEERGVDAETFDAIDRAQWPGPRKRAAADVVIVNDGSLEELEEEAREVWEAIAAPPGAGAWTVDLHLHTSASHDCLASPADVVRRARRVGLDRIAVTDHDRIEGALEARDLDPELVIVAEEVRTAEGIDLIGLFLERYVPPGGDAEEVSSAIRSQGGIVYLPHPFDRFRGVDRGTLERLPPLVDAVEGFNARVRSSPRNERARRWAAERGLPVGAGSDAHTLGEIGRGRVRLPPFRDAAGLLAALREGRIEGRPSGPWVHLASTWAKLRKRLPV